jgi:integral membrane protein
VKLNARTLFRTVAFAEALSWAGLLIGMYFKYGPADNPVGVKIFGMVHGIVFIGYLLTVLLVREKFGWSAKTFVLAGLSSIPPFCTAVFEVVADRKGLLAETVSPVPAGAGETESLGSRS